MWDRNSRGTRSLKNAELNAGSLVPPPHLTLPCALHHPHRRRGRRHEFASGVIDTRIDKLGPCSAARDYAFTPRSAWAKGTHKIDRK